MPDPTRHQKQRRSAPQSLAMELSQYRPEGARGVAGACVGEAGSRPAETLGLGGLERGRSAFYTAGMAELTHTGPDGAARMVDVGGKPVSHRIAVAAGSIRMQAQTLRLIEQGGHRKGDVLGTARIAGIMAAKRTAELIPLCHPLSITRIDLELELCTRESAVRCRARVEAHDQTGVEMEALMAVQVALLTLYDMCKSADRGMVIEKVCLLEKSGGRSGLWQRAATGES